MAYKDDEGIKKTLEEYGYIDVQVELMRSEALCGEVVNPSIIDYYDSNRTKTFKMIESTAYFESYKHVLQKLQEMSEWESFPMQEYITGHKKEVEQMP